MRADQACPADLDVVAYLNQIVNLRLVSDDRVAPAPSVDAGVRANLDAIAQDGTQQLRLLANLSIVTDGKPKAIGTNTNAAV